MDSTPAWIVIGVGLPLLLVFFIWLARAVRASREAPLADEAPRAVTDPVPDRHPAGINPSATYPWLHDESIDPPPWAVNHPDIRIRDRAQAAINRRRDRHEPDREGHRYNLEVRTTDATADNITRDFAILASMSENRPPSPSDPVGPPPPPPPLERPSFGAHWPSAAREPDPPPVILPSPSPSSWATETSSGSCAPSSPPDSAPSTPSTDNASSYGGSTDTAFS